MEVVSMAAEIYASAAGTIAQIWILSELFPRKQSVKKVYIVGWILLNFCIAHFVLLPNIWQSLLGMGVMLLMSCIMLEGRTEQKMLVIIACNVFMILVSMLRGRITFFLSGESINEISIQGSESLARVLGIVLTNTLYLVTAYILTRFFHDKIKLKKEEYIIIIIYYRNLLGGLYRENPVKSRNYEAVKSSKKWENVGNSYIIPALLLYRYSYI